MDSPDDLREAPSVKVLVSESDSSAAAPRRMCVSREPWISCDWMARFRAGVEVRKLPDPLDPEDVIRRDVEVNPAHLVEFHEGLSDVRFDLVGDPLWIIVGRSKEVAQ